MSEFSVHRTADTIPALKYCLILDGERIAGGKPDYRGNNHLISWSTRETYGPINQLKDENDEIKAENAKLRELVRNLHGELVSCEENEYICGGHKFDKRVRELGIEAC